ncbi:MAG TPA: hypothetical protein P5323_00280 [Candidatus Moranbacteria bacterium]|nr:hypothetical protein [Candidatus Moranbacteria bacterium]HRY27561.1 hypothetical protein [Candidatus Moranbacteria bacterium]HSA07790.1 hypothetical protein [Candidatus Moranbacteria bacterium]
MKLHKIKKILAISAISCLMAFAISSSASAALEYKMLEGLPGFYQKDTTAPDLPDLIVAIYKFGIWTVGIAGLLMMTIGGVMYMGSAGNNAAAQSAKGIITDALIGIIAALTAYLVMYVINPDLVKVNLSNLVSVTAEESAANTATTTPAATVSGGTTGGTDVATRTKLAAAGIKVNKLNCKSTTETNCTSLAGLKTSAVDNLIKLKKDCGTSCNVMVTGGTEGGHSSHSTGDKIDLRVDQSVKNFLLKNKNNLSSYGIKQICATDADASLRYNCTTKEKTPHYHVAFGS